MIFLSEASVSAHKEYLRNLKFKLSIFEKSYPSLCGKDCRGISRLKIDRQEREAALRLKGEILAHELYFDSFGGTGIKSQSIASQYGSEASFLYELFCECEQAKGDFLLAYTDERGKIKHVIENDLPRVFMSCTPILAVDLCEHAYFDDYRFDRSAYVKAALSCLNLSKIENAVANIKKR